MTRRTWTAAWPTSYFNSILPNTQRGEWSGDDAALRQTDQRSNWVLIWEPVRGQHHNNVWARWRRRLSMSLFRFGMGPESFLANQGYLPWLFGGKKNCWETYRKWLKRTSSNIWLSSKLHVPGGSKVKFRPAQYSYWRLYKNQISQGAWSCSLTSVLVIRFCSGHYSMCFCRRSFINEVYYWSDLHQAAPVVGGSTPAGVVWIMQIRSVPEQRSSVEDGPPGSWMSSWAA